MSNNQRFSVILLHERQLASNLVNNQYFIIILLHEKYPALGQASNQYLCVVLYKYLFAQYHVIKDIGHETR